MKIKKVLKVSLLVLASVIIAGIFGLMVWSATGTYPARTVALAALKSTDKVTITQDKYIVFTPTKETKTGLIFYPGGLVEPTAYAPVLCKIAEEGVLVVIAPMPFNLAILNTGAANAIIDQYPDISNWIIAGHSLGGASAAIFAYNNPTRIKGLVFWDSYPPDNTNLSEKNLAVLSIYGTTSGVPNTENFDDKRYLLPKSTNFIPIEGASHAQFGDYGPQKGDVVASISLNEQHEIVTRIMLDFIFHDQ